ncbi:MAG TPA: homocitrate synthase [Firmicutes bacterium]|jgi:homocitrate synthase NifV|nr:homocitrate synthase [Bacillota bacterium]
MKVNIVDTTLRDGEQSAGLIFTAAEKLSIAKNLDKAGVFAIEAGIPAMGKDEQFALASILSQKLTPQVIAWNRANINDIQTSVDCGFSCIHISIPVSDLHIQYKLKKSREWVLKQFGDSLAYARSLGCRVFAGAEDASRADAQFFLQVAEIAAGMGAERIRFADTIGCLEPFKTYEMMQRLVKSCALPIEIHVHNDFGLATANTVAAVQAGVTLASVTVGGIGERAGNASLQEVVGVLADMPGIYTGINPARLPELANIVSNACKPRMSQAL